MSKEKTYLKWYNKVGYGSGDVAGNVVYALLTSFVMIYLTDTIGLNAGVIGVLIAVSKIFDGVTDITLWFYRLCNYLDWCICNPDEHG